MTSKFFAFAVVALSLATTPVFAAKAARKAASTPAAEVATPVAMAPAQSNQSAMPAHEVKGSAVRKGLEFVGYYSMADKLKASYRYNNASYNAEFSGSGAPGFGVRYTNVKNRQVGVMVGLNMDLNRTFDSATVTTGSTTSVVGFNSASKPEMSIVTLEPNATYGFSEKSYVFGGGNYTSAFASGFESVTINSALGVQAGAGYNLDNRLNMEAVYRTMNFQFTGPASGDTARLWGFMLRGSYQFH